MIDAPNGTKVYQTLLQIKKEIGLLTHEAQTSIYMTFGSWAYISSEEIIGFVPIKNLNAVAKTTELQGKTIVVDPGHGGTDPGAVETELRKRFNFRCWPAYKNKALQSAGSNVVMTRDTDIFITLDARVAKAHEVNALIHLSVFTRTQIRILLHMEQKHIGIRPSLVKESKRTS
ncbi:N-acetylmuramoyl-L-alanine amidase [Anaerobacillus sp. HL2]|nr:N-acetylmuramoyl-L-alanine amidase [Anaerobacillus sp. HL2]